jgi:hypothetical protein
MNYIFSFIFKLGISYAFVSVENEPAEWLDEFSGKRKAKKRNRTVMNKCKCSRDFTAYTKGKVISPNGNVTSPFEEMAFPSVFVLFPIVGEATRVGFGQNDEVVSPSAGLFAEPQIVNHILPPCGIHPLPANGEVGRVTPCAPLLACERRAGDCPPCHKSRGSRREPAQTPPNGIISGLTSAETKIYVRAGSLEKPDGR